MLVTRGGENTFNFIRSTDTSCHNNNRAFDLEGPPGRIFGSIGRVNLSRGSDEDVCPGLGLTDRQAISSLSSLRPK